MIFSPPGPDNVAAAMLAGLFASVAEEKRMFSLLMYMLSIVDMLFCKYCFWNNVYVYNVFTVI